MNAASPAKQTLGIIAGSGTLPKQLVEACQADGRPLFVLAFDDVTDPAVYANAPHAIVKLEAIGESINHLRAAGVGELVLAGKVRRPSLIGLKPDMVTAKLIAHMGSAFFSGDNAMFSSIVSFLEQEGFKVVGSDEILVDLLAPEGVLGRHKPSQRDYADIAYGMKVAKMLGSMDIGQAVVVENNYVLGVEAAEGTDDLIRRSIPLKREAKCGVLVKAKKPLQERRVDLPAIGPSTVDNVHAAGLLGIAIEAGGALILDKNEVIARADKLGLFIVGIKL